MFSRSGKSTTSQYLVFREDNKWSLPKQEDEDNLDNISEHAFDESDFEVKIRSIDHEIDAADNLESQNKKRLGLRTIPNDGAEAQPKNY